MTVVERGVPTQEAPAQILRPPIPQKTENEPLERELLRFVQKKLWRNEAFKKASKGRGFLRKRFTDKFTDASGAILTIGYTRTKNEEVLTTRWSKNSPSHQMKNYLFEQYLFIAVSTNPSLSNTFFSSSYYKINNGAKLYARGGIEFDKAETTRQIRSFAAYYL